MTDDLELRANAMVQELANQRAILGDRAAAYAADNAALKVEIAGLKKRIAELQPKEG